MGVEQVVQQGSADTAELENTVRNLEAALATARLIGQAQGVLMAQRRCTAQEAFEQLVRLSQRRNLKLHQVAAELVQAVSPDGARSGTTPAVLFHRQRRGESLTPSLCGSS